MVLIVDYLSGRFMIDIIKKKNKFLLRVGVNWMCTFFAKFKAYIQRLTVFFTPYYRKSLFWNQYVEFINEIVWIASIWRLHQHLDV